MNHIEAMKQAVDALENVRQYDSENLYGLDDEITALRQEIEQAEKQEPVAWIYQNANTVDEYLVWKKGTGGINWRPLYTAPHKREWVGLTQEDIDIAFDDTQEGGGFDDFARAIEAKLKEKNIAS